MELPLPDEGPPTEVRPVDIGPCQSATCIAGASGVWVGQDGDKLRLRVGDRTLSIAANPSSPLRASHGIHGVAIGGKLAVVDNGATWDIHSTDGSTRTIPAPKLEPWRRAVAPVALDDGVIIHTAIHERHDEPITLIPPSTPPPEPGAIPISGARSEISAWLKPDDEGTTVIFADGTRRHTTWRYDARYGAHANKHLVLFVGKKARQLFGVDGSVLHPPVRAPLWIMQEHTIYVDDNKIEKLITPAQKETKMSFAPNSDFAGKPLPQNAVIERVESVGRHGRMFVLERVRLESCKIDDRLHVLDTRAWTITTLTQFDDKMRMHLAPTPTGFSFIEADAEYSSE